MPVAAADFYQGAVLSQIIAHAEYESIAPLGPVPGRYLVNQALKVWVRYSKEKSPWHFALSPEDLAELKADLADGGALLCLVCRRDAVCALDREELNQALDLAREREQTLTVLRVPGRKTQVSGPGGQVDHLIMGSAFPDKLFANGSKDA